MRVHEIVFLQGEEGYDVVDRLENVEGVIVHGATETSMAEAVTYLSQWDYGERGEPREQPWGTHDKVEEVCGYVLSWNQRLGYVGLYEKVEEEAEVPC